MLTSDLILKIKGLSMNAVIVLQHAEGKSYQDFIYIEQELKHSLTDEEIDNALKELASINIINEDNKGLLIEPLIRKIKRDKDTLQISINIFLLTFLMDNHSSIKDFIAISKTDKNTCLLFALLVDKSPLIYDDEGLTLSFNSIRSYLQVYGKYQDLKDFQKNLISKPIRLINQCLNCKKYTYEYIKKDNKTKSVLFDLANEDNKALET
jgi:hypothetical protein